MPTCTHKHTNSYACIVHIHMIEESRRKSMRVVFECVCVCECVSLNLPETAAATSADRWSAGARPHAHVTRARASGTQKASEVHAQSNPAWHGMSLAWQSGHTRNATVCLV